MSDWAGRAEELQRENERLQVQKQEALFLLAKFIYAPTNFIYSPWEDSTPSTPIRVWPIEEVFAQGRRLLDGDNGQSA